jgi:hypothetical protein
MIHTFFFLVEGTSYANLTNGAMRGHRASRHPRRAAVQDRLLPWPADLAAPRRRTGPAPKTHRTAKWSELAWKWRTHAPLPCHRPHILSGWKSRSLTRSTASYHRSNVVRREYHEAPVVLAIKLKCLHVSYLLFLCKFSIPNTICLELWLAQ